ncbi:N-alpha-acetyltransferase 30 [Gurleya vavrai]
MQIEYDQILSYEELIPISSFLNQNLSENYSFLTFSIFYSRYKKHCYTAKLNNKIIGAILSKTENDTFGYIAMIAVEKEYRRRGIGKNLIKLCLQSFIDINIYNVLLETEFDNKAAICVYKKMGFVITDFFEFYYLNFKHAIRLQYMFNLKEETKDDL